MSYHLEEIPIPMDDFSIMSQYLVTSAMAAVARLLERGIPSTFVNISHLDSYEVRSLLGSLWGNDVSVYLLWRFDQFGIATTYKYLVEYYDDLWYPSRDDLWVTEVNLSWLVEINHEEYIAVFVGNS
jgi:hypothetical protein